MQHLKTAKLAQWQIRLLSWSGGTLWLTGIVWLILHYYGQIKGDFGPETSPFEPWMLKVHGAAMTLYLLGVGSLLVIHIWRGWNYRSQRVLGVILSSITAILIITGYLLYYVGSDDARHWISVIHWSVGVTSLLIFVLHYRVGRRLRATTPCITKGVNAIDC
jgi:hypothetical protein